MRRGSRGRASRRRWFNRNVTQRKGPRTGGIEVPRELVDQIYRDVIARGVYSPQGLVFPGTHEGRVIASSLFAVIPEDMKARFIEGARSRDTRKVPLEPVYVGTYRLMTIGVGHPWLVRVVLLPTAPDRGGGSMGADVIEVDLALTKEEEQAYLSSLSPRLRKREAEKLAIGGSVYVPGLVMKLHVPLDIPLGPLAQQFFRQRLWSTIAHELAHGMDEALKTEYIAAGQHEQELYRRELARMSKRKMGPVPKPFVRKRYRTDVPWHERPQEHTAVVSQIVTELMTSGPDTVDTLRAYAKMNMPYATALVALARNFTEGWWHTKGFSEPAMRRVLTALASTAIALGMGPEEYAAARSAVTRKKHGSRRRAKKPDPA